MKLNESPSFFVGVLGLGLISVTQLYVNTAPDLQQVRDKQIGELSARQHLMDADLVVGTIAAIVSFTASSVMNSPWPALMLMGGFFIISAWFHLVLNSPPVA